MRNFRLDEIAKAVKGQIILGNHDVLVNKISKDSRKVSRDTLFFPLIGQVHDAHAFLPQVLEGGCKNWIVSRKDFGDFPGRESGNIILVEDTTEALLSLAVFVLDEMNAIKIGITGSVGKTSTKDMVFAVSSQKYKTGKTQGNLNTSIGISMCILDFDPDTKVAVLEMGTDHPGEIDKVAKVFKPHIGLITNVGQSHLENFGTRANIYQGKMELTNYFGPDDVLIIQQGSDFLQKNKISGAYRIVSVGTEKNNDFVVSNIRQVGEASTEFDLHNKGKSTHFTLPTLGSHHACNAAQAVAAGVQLGISPEEAVLGLKNFEMTKGRLDVKSEKGLKNSTIIDDAYNASPDSMKSGIQSLISFPGKRKVAILGDMLELGTDTEKYHREIGAFGATAGVDLILGVGKLTKYLVEAAEPVGIYYPDNESLIDALPTLIEDGDVVLVKASRGMALEEVVEYLLNTKETL